MACGVRVRGPSDLRAYLNEGGVLYDMKGVLPLGEADLRL